MIFLKRRVTTLVAIGCGMVMLQVYADNKINFTPEQVTCVKEVCFFPGVNPGDGDIHVTGVITWDQEKNLVVHTRGNIVFEKGGKLICGKKGDLILRAGMAPGSGSNYLSRVIFEQGGTQIEMRGEGAVKIYYNPVAQNAGHKYHNPLDYSYKKQIKLTEKGRLFTYMLINNLDDLQDIRYFPSGDYALSQDIDAVNTRKWGHGRGFEPLNLRNSQHGESKIIPFSGNFDGNHYAIKRLFINHPEEDQVGLFGRIQGRAILHNRIENLVLENFEIRGDHYVGSLAGSAINSDLSNIKVVNPVITSRDVAGGLIGTTVQVRAESIQVVNFQPNNLQAEFNRGLAIGGLGEASELTLFFATAKEIVDGLGGEGIWGVGNRDDQATIYLKTLDGSFAIDSKSSEITREARVAN